MRDSGKGISKYCKGMSYICIFCAEKGQSEAIAAELLINIYCKRKSNNT